MSLKTAEQYLDFNFPSNFIRQGLVTESEFKGIIQNLKDELD